MGRGHGVHSRYGNRLVDLVGQKAVGLDVLLVPSKFLFNLQRQGEKNPAERNTIELMGTTLTMPGNFRLTPSSTRFCINFSIAFACLL